MSPYVGVEPGHLREVSSVTWVRIGSKLRKLSRVCRQSVLKGVQIGEQLILRSGGSRTRFGLNNRYDVSDLSP
jgi:hypothetical protein